MKVGNIVIKKLILFLLVFSFCNHLVADKVNFLNPLNLSYNFNFKSYNEETWYSYDHDTQSYRNPLDNIGKLEGSFGSIINALEGMHHTGYDILNSKRNYYHPVYAIADGVVVDAKDIEGVGYYIRIKHEFTDDIIIPRYEKEFTFYIKNGKFRYDYKNSRNSAKGEEKKENLLNALKQKLFDNDTNIKVFKADGTQYILDKTIISNAEQITTDEFDKVQVKYIRNEQTTKVIYSHYLHLVNPYNLIIPQNIPRLKPNTNVIKGQWIGNLFSELDCNVTVPGCKGGKNNYMYSPHLHFELSTVDSYSSGYKNALDDYSNAINNYFDPKSIYEANNDTTLESEFEVKNSHKFNESNSKYIYKDVGYDRWSIDYIIDMSTKYKIINGYEDGTFKPLSEINRAEFLKMLIESMLFESNEYELERETIPGISDSDLWYKKYIEYAYGTKYQLIKSLLIWDISDANNQYVDFFSKQVTRAEVAQMITRAKKLFSPSCIFHQSIFDDVAYTHPAREEICLVNKNNIMNGYSKVYELYEPHNDNAKRSFKPENSITREEVTKVLCEAFFDDCKGSE